MINFDRGEPGVHCSSHVGWGAERGNGEPPRNGNSILLTKDQGADGGPVGAENDRLIVRNVYNRVVMQRV